MKLNHIHLDGADLNKKEKEFIQNIAEDLKEKISSITLSRFSSFLKETQRRDLNDNSFPLLKRLQEAKTKAGLVEFSPKLIRAVELLAQGESVRPLTNTLNDWKWSSYYNHYYHRGCTRMVRYEIDGPIYKADAIHFFPKPNYRFWQGYASTRLVKKDEFPINPLAVTRDVFYYIEPWNGVGSVDRQIAKSTRLEYPEFAEGWLNLQRSQFEVTDRFMDAIE